MPRQLRCKQCCNVTDIKVSNTIYFVVNSVFKQQSHNCDSIHQLRGN